jgi:hypothetical protein
MTVSLQLNMATVTARVRQKLATSELSDGPSLNCGNDAKLTRRNSPTQRGRGGLLSFGRFDGVTQPAGSS